MTEPDYDAAIWVESEPDPTGRFTYALTVHYTPDRSVMFSPDDAAAYAREVIAAAERATYAAAIADQLHDIAPMSDADEGMRLSGLLGDSCVPVVLAPVGGVTIEPRILKEMFKPSLHLAVHGVALTHWAPADAIRHALQILTMVETVRMDQRYSAWLREELKLDHGTAMAMMGRLNEYRHDSGPGTVASLLVDMLVGFDEAGVEEVAEEVMDDPRLSEFDRDVIHQIANAIGPVIGTAWAEMAKMRGGGGA